MIDPELLNAHAYLRGRSTPYHPPAASALRLGLIETPRGFVLTDEDGVHTTAPRGEDGAFPFYYDMPVYSVDDWVGGAGITDDTAAASSSMSPPPAEGEIDVATLLVMVSREEPLPSFVPHLGQRLIKYYQLLRGNARAVRRRLRAH